MKHISTFEELTDLVHDLFVDFSSIHLEGGDFSCTLLSGKWDKRQPVQLIIKEIERYEAEDSHGTGGYPVNQVICDISKGLISFDLDIEGKLRLHVKPGGTPKIFSV